MRAQSQRKVQGRRWARAGTVAAIVAAVGVAPVTVAHASGGSGFSSIKHIVVIYEENHSFDNLFGQWGSVNGQPVNGLAATPSSTTQSLQKGQDGNPYLCLYQVDVNLQPGSTDPNTPSSATCTGDTWHNSRTGTVSSDFTNQPFDIDTYIPPSATTCSTSNGSNDVAYGSGNAGGCTHDIVHRFYQEQYQIDNGKQDRYVQGSDAGGLTMGYYETQNLPLYQYLNATGSYAGSTPPAYSIEDNFFQGAFGGSFANHQALVSAQLPIFANADHSGATSGCSSGTASCDIHSLVDANGMPNTYTSSSGAYPYYVSPSLPSGSYDNPLTEYASSGACTPSFTVSGVGPAPAGTLCGDYAINTIQPFTQPYSPGTAVGKRLPLLTSDNIGDEMNKAGVSWGWYSGGWANAAGYNGADANHPLSAGWTAGATGTSSGSCSNTNHNASATFPYCPDALFQFHHQAFGYYANYADGTSGRAAHLHDELDLLNEPDATNSSNTGAYTLNGTLPQVAFIKPIGEENEHPGYGSDNTGQNHLVKMLQGLLGSSNPDAASTMVVVTYDEFGGQWDHVSPPGTSGGASTTSGPHDAFGPGTRIPAVVISPSLGQSGVDHSEHDTVSILTTIEQAFNVASITPETGSSVTTLRDASGNSLASAFAPAVQTPEGPLAMALPLGALAIAGLGVARRRRTRNQGA